MTNAIQDLFSMPRPGRGIFAVWYRNYLYFRHTMMTSMAWIFVEPILYLFALGYGLGQFVTDIDGMNYAEFIAPAMMAISGMFVAFFEGTYSTYTKLTRQSTYQTIVLAPISPDEILLGELLWISSKACLSNISVGIVLAAMGLVHVESMPPVLLVLFLMNWVFAAIGVWLAGLAKSYEWFSYSQSTLITPMSLFCGTYFPLHQLPYGLVYVAYALPLTHGLMSARMFLANEFNSYFIINIIYLFTTAIVFTNLAAGTFRRKLIV